MYNLFLEYFENSNKDRDNEVLKVINNNINSKLFDKIYIFTESLTIDILFVPIVEIIKINERMTFKQMFQYINELSSENDINIICNNDIYFDNTLFKLNDYDFNNKFLALLRRDVLEDGSSKLFEFDSNDCFNRKGHRTDSQDAWIFKGHIKVPSKSDFYFGILGCDNRIAYLMEELGYKVINACYDIYIYHLHLTNIRNYNQNDRICEPCNYDIKPCYLKIKFYSIGNDCNPIVVLKQLNLKTESGPFDTLLVDHEECIPYVNKLIANNFSDFFYKLKHNENGKIYPENYPHLLFWHDDNIMEDNERYKRRISRFMNDYNTRKCIFFYNITDNSLKTDKDIEYYYNHIKQLITTKTFIEKNHYLFIYIRYDEEESLYKDNCNMFIKIMKKDFNNIDVINYCRYYSKYGLWGNVNNYKKDFSKLYNLI